MGFPPHHAPLTPTLHTDIADESSGWFYGTAYDYDDETRMLHVMVPDKMNPTFDGQVLLDYRTVHLIECVDGKSDALFNKIVRDSIIKVKWELEWFEEFPEGLGVEAAAGAGGGGSKGKWVPSLARYYIRIANQLLVEDDEPGEKRGFVMITADMNVRFLHCSKGKGQEDFNQLVLESQVLSSDAAKDEARLPLPSLSDALAADAARSGPSGDKSSSSSAAAASSSSSGNNSAGGKRGGGGGEAAAAGSGADREELYLAVHKLLDMAKDLKECMQELLEERDKTVVDRIKMARAYHAFTMEGNLDAAFTLSKQMDEVIALDESSKTSKYRDEPEPQNATAAEAWHLITRLEKTLSKMSAGQSPTSSASDSRAKKATR